MNMEKLKVGNGSTSGIFSIHVELSENSYYTQSKNNGIKIKSCTK